ncbi:MAG: GNAT family N-acetyltransferase [Candidatus Woesearchaeota archaeon]
MIGYNISSGSFEFRHRMEIEEKPASIVIRPYIPRELKDICRIFTHSNPGKAPEEIMKWALPVAIENICHYQFAAEYKGKILGAVSGKVRDKRKNVNGYIDDIAIDKELVAGLFPELRKAVDNWGHRISIGSFLLDAVIYAFLNDRLPAVELDVYEFNLGARRFYDEHGFYVKETRIISPEEESDGFMVGATTYTMRRNLDSSPDAAHRWRKYQGIK